MELKTTITIEYTCEVDPNAFKDPDNWNSYWFRIPIGYLVYNGDLYIMLFDDENEITTLTRDVIMNMNLVPYDDDIDYVLVRDMEDDNLRESLIEVVMEAYAESLCE